MDEKEKEFWRKLDIPIDYILELELVGKDIASRIYNSIKNKNEVLNFLNSYFKLKSEDLKEALSMLRSQDKDLLFNIYAIFFYCRRLKEGMVSKRLKKSKVLGKYGLDDKTDLRIKLIPIFLEERNLLIDIYYDFLLASTNTRSFLTTKKMEVPNIIARVNRRSVESFFLQFQNEMRTKRKMQLWDLIIDDDKIKVFFRIERKEPVPVRFADSNKFYKTASWRTLIFSENGNKLDIFAKNKPDETIRIAKELMSYLTGFDVNYEELAKKYDPPKFVNFVRRVNQGIIENAKLYGIERKNAPLSSSPIMIIESQTNNTINSALEELNNLGINLIDDVTNIAGLKIELDQRTYRLKFRIEGSQIVIIFNNRNIPETEKENVIEFLDGNMN